jgi:Raf kinase inhibitor-like YbhB/YbcL family protein
MIRRVVLLALASAAAVLAVSAGTAGAADPFMLTSSAIPTSGGPFQGLDLYGCQFAGQSGASFNGGISPPLSWSNAPEGTKSFAIMLDDPDAVGGRFTHWITWGIDASATSLAAGRSGPMFGANDLFSFATRYYANFGAPASLYLDYFGPCPPPDTRTHNYTFHLYALSSSKLPLITGATRQQFEAAIAGKVLAEATLIGTVDTQ